MILFSPHPSMKITFLAQSWFLIQTTTKTIGIDIWLSNPVKPLTHADIPKLDYSCCTHDHGDHGFETMMELARRDDALFLSGYEMMKHAHAQWCRTEQASVWWLFRVDDDLELALVPAFHTSDTWQAIWFIFCIEGKTIYHMGDTAFMSEFGMIRDVYRPDIVMIPIGWRYTMWPREAWYALDILQPTVAIPMHYNTFPKIIQHIDDLRKGMKTNMTNIVELHPGETYGV